MMMRKLSMARSTAKKALTIMVQSMVKRRKARHLMIVSGHQRILSRRQTLTIAYLECMRNYAAGLMRRKLTIS